MNSITLEQQLEQDAVDEEVLQKAWIMSMDDAGATNAVEGCRHIFAGRPCPEGKRHLISQQEVQRYSEATYKVTTVIPYCHEPCRITYLIDQDGMDDLLENYGEYAEYIVGVELIEKPRTSDGSDL